MKREIVFLTSALAFSSNAFSLTIDGDQVMMTKEELARLTKECSAPLPNDENLSLLEKLESREVCEN